jgi:hypothetical protein
LTIATDGTPVPGGGTANTAFLDGGSFGPNAVASRVTATFWIELVQGDPNFWQLQYSQTIHLVFSEFDWPHVTVATLVKGTDLTVPTWLLNPFARDISETPGHGIPRGADTAAGPFGLDRTQFVERVERIAQQAQPEDTPDHNDKGGSRRPRAT